MILLICFDPFHIIERFSLILLLILGESRDYGNQLPNLISDLILIGFELNLNRFDLIWRFNWSKVDHDGPAAALSASSSQRSWKAHVAKSEDSSSAELDDVCGEATEHPSARLRMISGEADSLYGVALQQFRQSYELASWRNCEWLQGEVG